MTTRTRIALAASAAAAAAAAAVATAGGAHTTTLTLRVSHQQLSEVDVPPLVTSKTSPETPGDELISQATVSGGASGRRYLFCTVARKGGGIETALYACRVSYVLANGTIEATGVVHVSGPGPAVAAVVGGTGAYAGASGTLSASQAGVDRFTLN